MPLLLTPAQPLQTPSGLLVSQVYAIVDEQYYSRKRRQFTYSLGYYLHEAASAPDSGMAALSVPLPTGFSFRLDPSQIGALGDPTAAMEAYAQQELAALLGEGATIEQVE